MSSKPCSPSLSLSQSSPTAVLPLSSPFSTPSPGSAPGLLFRLLAGVKTLTPGTLGRRTGESKISEWSCGAGMTGLESRDSGSLAIGLLFLRRRPLGNGVSAIFPLRRWGRGCACECGVACRRQFLSRMRCRRTSLAGVRRAGAGREVEGGRKGEDWGSGDWL